MTPVPEMKLDVADAAELAGLLQFLSQWLARRTGGAAQKDLGRVKDHPRPIRPVKDQVRLGSCGRLLCGRLCAVPLISGIRSCGYPVPPPFILRSAADSPGLAGCPAEYAPCHQ